MTYNALIYAGATAVSAAQITGQTALQAIQDMEAIEQGVFFISGSGAPTFHDREFRLNQPSAATLGTAATPVMLGVKPQLDREHLINDITLSRPGGGSVRVMDTVSINGSAKSPAHRTRNSQITLAVTSDQELADAGHWLLIRYAYPQLRIASVVLDLQAHPALWAFASTAEISQRITLAGQPAVGPTGPLDFFIESLAFSLAVDAQTLTLELSPADTTSYLSLDNPAGQGRDVDALAY